MAASRSATTAAVMVAALARQVVLQSAVEVAARVDILATEAMVLVAEQIQRTARAAAVVVEITEPLQAEAEVASAFLVKALTAQQPREKLDKVAVEGPAAQTALTPAT